MKIEVTQYTNINDKQVAVEEFDGTLDDYLEFQLKHIRDSDRLSLIQKSIGEGSFSLVVSDKTLPMFNIIYKAKIISRFDEKA